MDVVLVHGLACDSSTMAPLAERLDPPHTMVNLDLTTPNPLDAVRAALEGTSAEAPVLVGHSMGALVALAAAASGLASAAVLLDPAPMLHPRARSWWAGQLPAIAADVDGGWRRAFAQRLVLPTDGLDPEAIAALMMRHRPDAVAAHASWLAGFDAPGALRAVAACGIRLLVISAEGAEDLNALTGLCPTATVERMPDVGHFVMLARPDQVAARVQAFLG